jgi:hypothetical protein
MGLFEEALDVGDLILNMLDEDWNIFSDDLGDEERGHLLLSIANNDWDDDSGEPPLSLHELYTRREHWGHTSQADLWSEFCSEILDDPEAWPFNEVL